jgi:tetratricopeptide (TPR) repeat protein
MYGQEQWFDRSHNVFFDWLTAGGVLGLLSYLSVLFLAFYTVWKKTNLSRLEKSLITGMFAGYFFHNLFVFDNVVSYIMFFSVLAYINSFIPAKVADGEAKEKEIKKSGDDMTYYYGGMALAVVIFIAIFYQYNYKPISANLALIRALTPTQIVSGTSTPSTVYTAGNIEAFKKAISRNTIGLYETREQLLDIAQKSLSTNSDVSVKQGLVDLAKAQITEQLKETPNDVRYYVIGGGFYMNIGDGATALDLLTKAEKLSPNKQSLLFLLGNAYFGAGQHSQALAVFKKAYEVDKSFDEAKLFYGLVAFYTGNEEVTNSLLGPGPIMDPRFLSAYKQTKKYDLMMAYLQKNATARPMDIATQVSLAAGYMTIGNRTKAIEVLQKIKAMAQNADITSQVDGLVRDIQNGKNPLEGVN